MAGEGVTDSGSRDGLFATSAMMNKPFSVVFLIALSLLEGGTDIVYITPPWLHGSITI